MSENNLKTTLGEDFRRRQGDKWGTHTLRLRTLASAFGGTGDNAQLARELEYTGHQMAGLLETFVKEPGLPLARSYERGNPHRGRASVEARKSLGLDQHLIDPTAAKIL